MLRYLRSHRPRRLRLLAVLALLACGGTTVAYGYLTATSEQGSTVPLVEAQSLAKPTNAPTASVASGTVTVGITQDSVGGKLLGTYPAGTGYSGGGYRVRRHTWDASTSTLGIGTTPTSGTCMDLQRGTTATLSCTDTSAPLGGTYKYTVVPVLNNFTGPASDASAAVTLASSVATPTGLAATPTSPSADRTPTITGQAVKASTVALYTNATCTSAARNSTDDGNAVGTTPNGGTFSIDATVPADSTTTFYAQATMNGNKSACSRDSATFTHNSLPEPKSVGRGAPQAPATNNGIAETGDKIVLTYSEPMRASTVCTATGWPTDTTTATGSISNATVTLTKKSSGNSNTTEVTINLCPNVAPLTLGSKDYVVGANNATLVFTGSTISLSSAGVLTVQLGTPTTAAPTTAVTAAVNNTWKPVASTDIVGQALSGTVIATTSSPNF